MKIKKGKHQAIFRRENRSSSSVSSPHISPSEHKQQNIQHSEKPPVVVVKQENKTDIQLPAKEISKELLRIQGTWPFDFAPDELIIEEKRIIIKRHTFPVGGSVISLPLNKLVSFEVNQAFFYSALYIKGEGESLDYLMQWLKPKDAVRAKEIIDGLRLKQSESIEIKEKDPHKIAQTLQSLGHT